MLFYKGLMSSKEGPSRTNLDQNRVCKGEYTIGSSLVFVRDVKDINDVRALTQSLSTSLSLFDNIPVNETASRRRRVRNKLRNSRSC